MHSNRQENEQLRQSLIRLSSGLAELAPALPDSERAVCDDVVSALRRSVIPQLAADFPLLVAVTGGGSSGKSTVFNALAGAMVSAPSPRAGYTRRMVAAIHPKVAEDKRKMALLFERFRANARPRKVERPDEPVQSGDPVYAECPSVPERLVLLDTPDFDTGTAEGFTNRDAATEILDVSDVFLYLVTNQTYNSKSASDYIRSILSKIGARQVALLYRCPPAFSDDDVREHMQTTLSHLYPDPGVAAARCIGFWRIDESNEVAAGHAGPEFRPLAGGIALREALGALDPTVTRAAGMRSAIDDGLRRARGWIAAAESTTLAFAAYRDALRFLTSVTCKQCLAMAPQRDILRLFTEEWEAAQPWVVRHGHYLSRGTAKALGTVRGWLGKKQAEGKAPSFAEAFRKTFLDEARALQKAVESPAVRFDFPKDARDMQPLIAALKTLSGNGRGAYSLEDLDAKRKAATVARPVISGAEGRDGRPAGERLARMADQAAAVLGDTESIRPEIRGLVRAIRQEMTNWQRAREWFSASLDTVALSVALTYVASTGDAFTGGTLLSMFGLNDLVAVPALGAFIAAHSTIDKATAERQLEKLFTTWAARKAPAIRAILEEGITGADIAACDAECKRLDSTLAGLKADLDAARTQSATVFGTPP